MAEKNQSNAAELSLLLEALQLLRSSDRSAYLDRLGLEEAMAETLIRLQKRKDDIERVLRFLERKEREDGLGRS